MALNLEHVTASPDVCFSPGGAIHLLQDGSALCGAEADQMAWAEADLEEWTEHSDHCKDCERIDA